MLKYILIFATLIGVFYVYSVFSLDVGIGPTIPRTPEAISLARFAGDIQKNVTKFYNENIKY